MRLARRIITFSIALLTGAVAYATIGVSLQMQTG
jgi:hypothetical protein